MFRTKIGVTGFGLFVTSMAAVGAIALAGPVKREGRKYLRAVACPRDGIVLVVGSEIKKGDQVPPEDVVAVKAVGKVEKYRRWKEGDRVKKGQLLVRLDDRLAQKELHLQRAKLTARIKDYEGAVALRNVYEKELDRLLGLQKKGGGVKKKELATTKSQLRRYTQEAIGKYEAIKGAEREVGKAWARLEVHKIRSPVSGVIHAVNIRPGEAVQANQAVVIVRGGPKR
jgi:multidrug efflux pump subunit AcrA (membrane-fusion protein)